MTAPFRLTTPTRLVLAALRDADEPVWGFDICRTTGLKSGTIYPILNRLNGHGWVEAWLEDSPHPGRPPRRYYQLTARGRGESVTPRTESLPEPANGLEGQVRRLVRQALADAGLTQAAVARRLGISTKHLSMMLNGGSTLSLTWADRITQLAGQRIRIRLDQEQP
ncbi:helix-turn-helix transcriptional regulator [Streptomyces sp. NPDC015220]|uniref:helix-turn-helix transcriptional regulator n=1 Tax=Streptomyces sp. NPDC015220 TaxID=3364947 RepID=UPI0036FA2536